MRLEQPKALASLLLDDNPNWSPQRIDTVIGGDDTIHVPLSQTVPVYILYWDRLRGQHWPGPSSAPTPYDWDHKLMDLLNAAKSRDSDAVNLTT